ncbi:hypothetical protein BC827DRAFT_1153718 [Russula dissimulans]|nr:hypothetical protein BC827DRAFT_1153718 [Russula dissimulans]
MHAEELPQTQCPQLVGDDEAKMSEGVCRDYPHPSPVSVDDLSTHDRRILESIMQGSRVRVPERRGKTRRYAAIFDEKGLPLPSATGVVIGGARSSMLLADGDGKEEDELDMAPIVISRAVGSGKSTSTGIRAALRHRLSSAARSVFTCRSS